MQFSALFSYMLWHIELKFCIWLCFTVLQIKFECRQFPSIFVGVMPLLECRILKIHSFPHFSLTRLGLQTGRIMVWWCPSVRVSIRLSLRPTLRPSVRLSVRPSDSPSVRPTLRPSGSPSARFPHFSPTCFDTLSWNFAHDFVLMYYRSSSSVINLRQFWRSYGSLELRI